MRIGRAVKHLLEESDDADAAAERLPLLGGGGGDGSVGSDLRQSDPNREFIVAQQSRENLPRSVWVDSAKTSRRVALVATGLFLGVCGLIGVGISTLSREGEPDFRTLPAVDWSGKTLLIVTGVPFTGTTALESLIGTSNMVADLCKAKTWACESSRLLNDMFGAQHQYNECKEEVTGSAAQYAYTYTDFARKYWDLSKPVLMDKDPGLRCRYKFVRDAAAQLGVPVKFVLLVRHPYSMNSVSKK